MSTSTELAFLGLCEAAELVRAGEVSPVGQLMVWVTTSVAPAGGSSVRWKTLPPQLPGFSSRRSASCQASNRDLASEIREVPPMAAARKASMLLQVSTALTD